jgi:raffinose/stachyose/melibiose transport system permease protein
MKRFKNLGMGSKMAWILAAFFIASWTVITVYPFIFMVLNSFKGQFEILANGVFSIPESFNLDNYKEVFDNGISRYFLNSIIVCAVSLIGTLIISALAAYPVSRLHSKVGKLFLLLVLACMSIPEHITLIPIFKFSTNVGLYDSLLALIGPDIAFALPISIFILSGFMEDLPSELEEAGEIDGCSRAGNFFHIVLPLTRPGMATLAIYNGVAIWNEFIFSYTLTQNKANRTLPLAIWDFQGAHSMNAPMIMAVLTITTIPMLILFAIFQEKLMDSMTIGAVKG